MDPPKKMRMEENYNENLENCLFEAASSGNVARLKSAILEGMVESI